MVDRVENQAPKPEEDRVKAAASSRSLADAFSDRESSIDSAPFRDTSLLKVGVSNDNATTPVKPSDGAKPEPGAVIPPKDTKVSPGDIAPARVEPQTPREAVTPTNHPVEKVVDSSTKPAPPTRASEQPITPTDGAMPKVQNQDVQPSIQRPSEVLPTQAAAKVPEKAPDRVSTVAAEQPSDKAHLPGLAIVGPEGKAQQGNAGTVGTTDGKAHDPVVAKPPDLAARSHDPATQKAQEALGAKANDTGLRGSELGTGALTGKIQAGPDQVRANDHPNAQSADVLARQNNGASVLKNYSADGIRSGVDHTNQGIVAKGADGKPDGVRAGQVSLNDGKIADGKLDGDRSQTRLPDGRMPEGKIGDGSSSGGRPGEVKFGDGKIADGKVSDGKTSDGKAGDGKTGDRLPDGKVGGKTSDGGSSGPSAFIQFIESQAGLRGFGLPAKPEGSKADNKADGKLDNKQEGKTDGVKNNLNPDGRQTSGDTKGGVGIPGGRSNAIDGFLGLVETVKDNIKGSLKNLGDRAPVSVPLKEGEMAAVAMRGKMPPLRDDITSDQILAVLIPKGYVGWSIVRSPGLKPSDSPLPSSQSKFDGARIGEGKSADGKPLDNKPHDSKPNESKPFDINNPEVKSRPFIQLHGVDSNYTGAGARRTDAAVPGRAEQVKADQVKVEPARLEPIKNEPSRVDQVKPDQTRPIPVKAEPLTDTKVAAAAPYLDVSANSQIIDQSATRQTIPSTSKDRRQLIEEQEHTLPSTQEGEKRSRYVNSALDAQEVTWNSEDDAAAGAHEMPAPLGRYTYIVRAGDTIESVAVVELNDLSLAPLLFKKNKKYVLQEEEYGKHPLVPGVVIDLPTPAEIKAFRQF